MNRYASSLVRHARLVWWLYGVEILAIAMAAFGLAVFLAVRE